MIAAAVVASVALLPVVSNGCWMDRVPMESTTLEGGIRLPSKSFLLPVGKAAKRYLTTSGMAMCVLPMPPLSHRY